MLTYLQKIKNLYKNNRLSDANLFLLNWVIIRLFNIKIEKHQKISLNKTAKKIFSKCSLKKYKNEYWYLDPMPSESDLKNYYESLYWNSRNEKNMGVNTRDLLHLLIIKKYIPEFKKGKSFLNFGAGHGGMSHLAWSNGLNVLNVEPSGLPNFYSNSWITYNLISQIPDKSIDILYASHSIEHVQNIDNFITEVKRILRPKGICFWEVPNARCKINGVYARKKKVVIPHTYDFNIEYFIKLFDTVRIVKSFDQSQRLNDIENWEKYSNSKGGVIRVIGMFNN